MLKKTALFLFAIILLVAPRNHSVFHHPSKQTDGFLTIDEKLDSLAKTLGTKVETSGGGSSFDDVVVPKEKIQLRKIIWVDGRIGKAIILSQNFQNKHIDAPDWDFINLAWLYEKRPLPKGQPFWQKNILEKVSLKKIEATIDQLLKESLENLSAIKESDLGYN